MKLKFSSQKVISLIFIFLMAGSTFAYAILSAFKNPGGEVKIPNERIINYELNQEQRAFLLQRGYTLIKYEYYNGCMECADTKTSLESLTNNADNQMFLQEILSDQASTQTVMIASFKGEKTMKNPSNLDLQTNICNLITNKPLWCITSKL